MVKRTYEKGKRCKKIDSNVESFLSEEEIAVAS